MLRVVALLFTALLFTSILAPGVSAEVSDVFEGWGEKEILVEMPLKLNVVFLGGDYAAEEGYLEEKLREVLPWYAPYVAYEEEFLGINLTEIELNVIQAPRSMVEEYVDFIMEVEGAFREPDIAYRYVSKLEEELNRYFEEKVGILLDPPVYWVDAWLVANWLKEKGEEYLGIQPNEYTIYFLISALEVNGVVEYFVDSYSPETGEYFFTGGMSAYGGLDRIYFIDLTSVPLGNDRCEGEPGCKSPTPDYYPTLWEIDRMSEEEFYELLATYISETIIYVFFRGYLWAPRYETNFYEYLLIIDATEYDEAEEILSDFSYEYLDAAIGSLIPYAYRIIEYDVVDVDEYPKFRDLLFSTLQYEDDSIVVDCERVPEAVFKLPLIKRPEGVRTLVTVLFIFDEPAYVCRKYVVGRAFKEGAISAINLYTLKIDGPSLTLYHEAGHVLGLRHPHDSDPIPWGEDLVNWFYDWSATPMSYDEACTFRTMYEGFYFAQMDMDSMDMGLVIYLMRRARETVGEALRSLRESGLEDRDIPAPLVEVLMDIKADLEGAVEEFRRYNYFNWIEFYGLGVQKASAFDYALSAYERAVFFSEMSEKTLSTLIEMRDMRLKLEEAVQMVEELRERNMELREELESIKKSYEELLSKHSALEEQYKELEGRLESLSSKFEELKSDYSLLASEKDSLEKEVGELREKLRESSEANTVLLSMLIIVSIVAASLLFLYIKEKRKLLPPPPPPPPA